MPIQCLEGLNPVTHTWPNFSLPLYSCCNIKKNGLFNSSCSAETLSTRTSTALIKLVLTPSPRTSLFCNCHDSSPNKVGIFLLCLIKSMLDAIALYMTILHANKYRWRVVYGVVTLPDSMYVFPLLRWRPQAAPDAEVWIYFTLLPLPPNSSSPWGKI